MEKVDTFNNRLLEEMKEKEYSQYTLSSKSGVPRTSISGYLSDVSKPSAEATLKLALGLGVEPLWLLGYDVPKTKHEGIRDNIDELLNSMNEKELNRIYKVIKIFMKEC